MEGKAGGGKSAEVAPGRACKSSDRFDSMSKRSTANARIWMFGPEAENRKAVGSRQRTVGYAFGCAKAINRQ